MHSSLWAHTFLNIFFLKPAASYLCVWSCSMLPTSPGGRDALLTSQVAKSRLSLKECTQDPHSQEMIGCDSNPVPSEIWIPVALNWALSTSPEDNLEAILILALSNPRFVRTPEVHSRIQIIHNLLNASINPGSHLRLIYQKVNPKEVSPMEMKTCCG